MIFWASAPIDEDIQKYVMQCYGVCNAVSPEDLVGNYTGHMVLHKRLVLPILMDVLRYPKKVLDFGCGVGRLSGLLDGMGHRVIGVDVSQVAMTRAALLVPSATFVYVGGDGMLPFPPESFDAVVSMITFQHIQFAQVRDRYFEEFHRVLRPHGILLGQFNADDSGEHIRWGERGDPENYEAPDVVCNEGELDAYLTDKGFAVLRMWRTECDTIEIAWAAQRRGKADAWLWAHAVKASP